MTFLPVSVASSCPRETGRRATLADCKSSNLIYQLQCKKCEAFYIGETGQILSKCVNGHRSICTVANYRYPSTSNPTSSLSKNAGPSTLFINSQIPPLTMSAANMKWRIYSFWNSANSQVSTSYNLTGPPPPLLPVFPLAAPPNTGVSLPLQLMKAAVPAESYTLYPLSLQSAYSGDVFFQQPGSSRSLSLFLIYFYHFIFPGFPFVLLF